MVHQEEELAQPDTDHHDGVHNPNGSVGQQGFVSGFLKVRQMSHDGSHSIQLSYLEVYNETVRDLLSPGRPLLLREDKQQKWFKGKEKVNNVVLFNEATYVKLIIEVPKYKQDTKDEDDNYVPDRVAESGDPMHYLGSWKSLLYAAAVAAL